jgi:hypothetical protein
MFHIWLRQVPNIGANPSEAYWFMAMVATNDVVPPYASAVTDDICLATVRGELPIAKAATVAVRETSELAKTDGKTSVAAAGIGCKCQKSLPANGAKIPDRFGVHLKNPRLNLRVRVRDKS